MANDTRTTAALATRYVPDMRVRHFWDLWKFGSRTYSQQLKVPADQAWDMFVFYKPHIVWTEFPPEPTFWMQARHLDVGQPYSQDDLEKALVPWLGN